ncbi:MAG: hypothetical protein COA36_11775 [Desulfotalea sp.]|nr:MAG: hypothetical protein COA36_11775 [Desulfotalea sp.]
MSAPIVYRWDDAEAPIARGQQDSVVNILKACLVDGYGDKPGAGWTMPFCNVEGTKAAFRNNAVEGTGMFLQVNGELATGTCAGINGYESMTDELTGISQMIVGTGVYYMSTGGQANVTEHPWILIADSRCFYFICWFNNTLADPADTSRPSHSMFFGDINSVHPSDNYGCALIAPNHPSYGSYLGALSAATSVTSAHHFIARNLAGDLGSKPFGCVIGGGPSPTVAGKGGADFGPEHAFYMTRPYVNDSKAYTLRGYMPGFNYPCHDASNFPNQEIVTYDGRDFLCLRIHYWSQPYCVIFIDIGEGFRP